MSLAVVKVIPSRLPKMSELRPDSGVVQPRGDGMRGQKLAVFVGKEERFVALHDSGPAFSIHPGRVFPVLSSAPASRLHPDKVGAGLLEKGEKNPIAFEPPPTQATMAAQSMSFSLIWDAVLPITD